MLSARSRAMLCLLTALLILCSLLPCAFAEGQDAANTAENTTDNAAQEAETSEADSSQNSGWPSAEAAIRDLIEEYEVDDTRIALAYYNTVTGEEYYLNPDQYMDAASLYKVPLNMVYAERVANGELDPEGNIGVIPYRTLLEETIINSNNDMAQVLIAQFNGYQNYRRAIAPYMGVDPDNVDWKYYENNYFTPRQMLTCLKLLYSEPERFPSVQETMEKAEPNNYFCRDEHRYTIAHKYGWNEENGLLSVNDCAIIPTEDPIIIVLFTNGINRQLDFLTAFCTRCIDYTEASTAARKAAEEAERLAQEAAAKELEEQAIAESEAELSETDPSVAEVTASPAETQPATGTGSDAARSSSARLGVIVGAAGFVCVAFVLLLVRQAWRRRR